MAEPTFEEEIDPSLLQGLQDIDQDLLAGLQDVESGAIDPELAARQVSAYGIDPELTPERIEQMGELTDIGAMLEGRERGTLDTIGENLSQAALNAITTDPMELADILTNRFPEEIEVRLSPEGVPVARNKHTGMEVAINKPGMSPMDVYQFIGLAGQYAPAGKWAMGPLQSIKSGLTGEAKRQARKVASRQAATRAVAGEGATEYGAQKLQEAAGGRMDPGEVAFTALTAAVPELVATPIATMGRKVYDIAKDNVVIDEGVRKAIEYARSTGRKIATSDVLMETIKAPRRIFLKAAERIPLIGTSGMKLRQAQERTDTLEHLFDHFGLSGDTEYGKYIASNFANESRKIASDSNKLRTEAFGLLAGGNVEPRRFRNILLDEGEAAAKLEPDQRRALQNWLTSVGKDFEDLDRFSFKDADVFLNSLMEGAAKGDAKGQMKGRLADALVEDMKRYAKETDISGFNKWDLARNLGLKELKNVEDKALREAIQAGNISPGVVDRLLDTGRNKDINALLRRTDATGKDLIRKRVMAQAFRKAGGDLSDMGTINLDSLVRVLDKDPATTKGMARYFTDGDRQLVEGAKEYLRATAKSAKAFEAMGMLSAGASQGGGKRMIAGMMAALMPPTQAIVAGARMHESNYVRDMLLRLYATDTASVEARQIMAELRPALISLGQTSLTEGRDPFSPEIEPTAFEKFVGGTGLAGKQMVESVGEFVEPAVESGMEYLRAITGIGEEEDATSP